MLSDAQRKYLRRLGHELNPVVLIGASGLGPSLVAEMDGALAHHELVKVRARVGDRKTRDAVLAELASPLLSEGGSLVAWKGSRETEEERVLEMAGESLAMSRMQILRSIILKQAFQKVYPALSSQIIIVMLGSAVVSQISAEDLTYAANFVASRNFRNFEVYLLAALAYLLLAMLTRSLLRALGRVIFKAR